MKFLISLVFLLIATLASAQQYFGGTASPSYKSAVASVAALPASGNSVGDVRLETTTYNLYGWNGVSWIIIPTAAGGGTVTSVGLTDGSTTPIYSITGSPINGAGVLNFSLKNESANLIFSGPAAAGPSQPTFRSLVSADIPALPYASSTLTSAHLLVGNVGNVATDVAASGDLTLANTGSFTIANSAVTNAKIANSTIDLTTKVTGILPVANGGTNSSAPLNNNRVMTSSGGAVVEATAITANKALASNASGIPVASATTDTELGYVSGVTSAIQTQLNAKQSSALATNDILVGSAGALATPVAMSGDATIISSGALTIANSAVTNAKIANATIDLTTKVTGLLPLANLASLQVNKHFDVDGRSDSYTVDGSSFRPFKTISAAISQIIANADNAANAYTINVAPGTYNETLTFNNALLYNVNFVGGGAVVVNNPATTVLLSNATNTNLATLTFDGFTFNGGINLSGDINGSNFGSSQIVFKDCSFETGTNGITLFDVNNVSWYGGQIHGSTAYTFTNVAFAYIQGAEGLKSGTTLNLVENGGLHEPAQTTGNYLLLSESKTSSTVSIDAGSELDMIQSYESSSGAITNNGILHSFNSTFNGALTLNNGSSSRFRGDVINATPTIGATATVVNQTTMHSSIMELGQAATPANPPANSDKLYFKNDNNLYTLTSAGTETKVSTGGTVTSVAQTVPVEFSIAGSPVTTSGTLAITKANENANLVWAGPTSGGAAQPTFRSLVAADIPSLSATYLPLAGGTMSGAIDMGSNLIHNVTNPVVAQDAATKNYVDGLVNGLTWKNAAAECTAAALPANTYNNGASGVGATLTEVGNGALTVDGIAVTSNDRVLVKNEVTGANNGIYSVTATGSAGTPYVLTRTSDFNQSTNISEGDTALCVTGTVNSDTAWSLATTGAITVGTTSLSLVQVSGPGSIIAGTGISIAGNTVSLQTPVVIANGGTNSTAVLNNNRVMTSSGGAIVEASAITGNRAVVSNASGIPVASVTTDTEITYVNGVTSAIQTQLNGKQSTALTTNHILVGSAGALATDVAMSGDATMVASGALTIANSAVTNAKIANTTIDLTAKVTNQLPVANGGTGDSTLTSNGVLYGNGVGAVQVTAQGAAGTVLHGNGGAPSFSAITDSDLPSNVPVVNTATKTTTYTAVSSDVVLADATGGAFTVTIPLAASNTNKMIRIKKIDSSANAITVLASGADTIDGQASQLLPVQNNSTTLISNGTLWYAF